MDNANDIEVARRVEPPNNLPTPKAAQSSEASFFAESTLSAGLGDERKVFGILRDDRRRHMYVLGKTGIGKTKMLEHLIRADMYYGYGVCVVDPTGDLVHDLLDFVPKERVNDVILIDPSDPLCPVAWNPLANVPVSERHHIVASIVEVFSRLFGAQWNPRAEYLLRFALLAILESPKASLANVLNFVTDPTFRADIVATLPNDIVRRFWEKEFPNWSSMEDRVAQSALVNALSSFLSHPALHAVFSGLQNTINLETAIRENKIIFVTVSKSALGDVNASIFGSLFLAMFKRAALSRSLHREPDRSDFYLYVDELQNVASESFLELLSEGGRNGICITASNQYLDQLSRPLRNSMFGNIATLVTFQVCAVDAEFLEKEFAPQVELRDMINLPEQEFYIKLSINGRRYDPFSAKTLTVEKAKWPSERNQIIAMCQEKYCRKP